MLRPINGASFGHVKCILYPRKARRVFERSHQKRGWIFKQTLERVQPTRRHGAIDHAVV